MHYNIIKTAAGARTRLRLPMVWKADAVAAEELPEAVFWVFIGGERVRVEKTPHSDDEYIFPALQAGQYAWDLVVDAQVVLHGVLKVRGSAVPPGGGEVCGTLLVDAPAMVLVLSPGPRGEVGPQGVQGFSAYEVAVQHGYEGSEADWAEELSGAQAAATESKRQAGLSASSATAAAESAKAAAGSATEADKQAKAAAESATTADNKASAAEQSAKAASDSAAEADNKAKAAEGSASEADKQAKAAAGSAAEADKQAKAAEGSAAEADNKAKAAAVSATTAGEKATAAANSAKAAESSASAADKSADDAAATLADAAQETKNNKFSATNTFNGALVANGSLFYKQLDMSDWLTCSIAARLMEAGINPVSAFAEKWEDWVDFNPNWTTLEHLVFYAPLLQGSIPQLTSATSVSSCTYISPAALSNSGVLRLLGEKFNIFTLGIHEQDVDNCHTAKSCSYYAPRVTKMTTAFNAFAISPPANTAELSIFTPELTEISQINTGRTFRRLGTLKTFSIYAPKLVTSFYFADVVDNGGKAQYCSVLHSLVAGIGKPDTETAQIITTKNPIDNTDENISALQTAAADKNWQFNFV